MTQTSAHADDEPERPSGPAAAAKPPAPPTPIEAADAVLVAVAAKDDAALASLAAEDAPDPWLVADELIVRGAADAAAAFAKASPRIDVAALPAFVASRRSKPVDRATRVALSSANVALRSRDFAQTLKLLDATKPGDDPILMIGIAQARGFAFRATKKSAESAEAFLAGGKRSKALGWLARADGLLHESGMSAVARSDWAGALVAWQDRLTVAEKRADHGWVVTTLGNIGILYKSLGDFPHALEFQQRALKLEEELGNREGIARALGNLGNVYIETGDYPRALAIEERALKLHEELGNRAGIARALGSIGTVHVALGDYPLALEFEERALALMEELEDRAGVARTLGNIGSIHRSLGDLPRALEIQERALKSQEELGDRAGVALTLANVGLAHWSLGDYPRALEFEARALKLMEEIGNKAGVAKVIGNMGILRSSLGDFPRALELQERALQLKESLGDRAGAAETLGNIGLIYGSLGEFPRELEIQERALKLQEGLGNRAGIALTLGNIGSVHASLGDFKRALEIEERVLKLTEDLRDRAGVAAALASIGSIHTALLSYPKALEFSERALKLTDELRDQRAGAVILGGIGSIHLARADYPRALASFEAQLARAEALGARALMGDAHWWLSLTHLARKDPAAAAASAHRSVDVLARLATGLAEEQGAKARERFSGVFGVGARAARALDDPEEAAFFLESGRAATLLEALGGRDALRAFAVPEELRGEESRARAAEGVARSHQLASMEKGDLAEIRNSKKSLDEAQATVGEVIEKIQRQAKAASSVVYPKADTLGAIRGRIKEGEALVMYGVFTEEVLALVVTPTAARVVALLKPREIESACEARDWAKLRTLVVEPLALGSEVRRLFCSPMGVLASVPFCLLAPEREVVYMPSGTTYGVLLDEAGKRGEGVLALGDPDYGAKEPPRAIALLRGGRGLPPLPATRIEAKAVGDVLLLGVDASVPTLEAKIQSKTRWHAVHLACHGLVDLERPRLSSLALSNGGFLTMLDVFRSKVPADLVVLSACETARGKVYSTEGVEGFVRAFLFAGAPRVIVSLWKVDDEATRVLMTQFYALWNPKDGKPGVPVATALRQAQQFVAAQEKWKDSNFWAAWQLWGLPE